MAKYDIHHSCGHAETKDLFGKETDRQRYIAWAGAHGQCSACRRANKDAEVMAVEVEHDLPLLTGSDKQIAWARAIRAEQVTAMMAHLDGIRAKTPAERIEEFESKASTYLVSLCSKSAARFWIDNRDLRGNALLVAAK